MLKPASGFCRGRQPGLYGAWMTGLRTDWDGTDCHGAAAGAGAARRVAGTQPDQVLRPCMQRHGSSAAIAGKDPGTARAHAVIAALEVEAATQRIAQSGASAAMRCWPRSIMMRTPVVHSSGSKITKQESLEMAAYIQEHNQHSALEAHTQIYI